MTVGERIKQRRIDLGITQTDLAKKMGYKTKSTICEVEKSGNNLTQSRISKFAEALGVTPAYLMGWEDGKIDLTLTDGEKEIVIEYRKADDATKEMVKRILAYKEKLK